MKREKTTDAIKILHNRYIKDDVNREISLETERINAKIARMIYELRQDKGLSQTKLAKLIGTTQSVISRLEDADYEGHSLSMLQRIAKALDCEISISLVQKGSRYADKPDDDKQELIIKTLDEIKQRLNKIETNVEEPKLIVVKTDLLASNFFETTPLIDKGQMGFIEQMADAVYSEVKLNS